MPSAHSTKRKAPLPGSSHKPSKRARNDKAPLLSEVIEIDDDSDDDLELKDILAQIKAQEDSERLAKQLQDDNEPSTSRTRDHDVINLSVDDDAAIAQRLAEEWAKEDAALNESVHEGRTASSGTGPSLKSTLTPLEGISLNTDASNRTTRPDDALQTYRAVFTRTRSCSKCGKDVKSPRGCVMFSDASIPPSMAYLLHAPCSSCRTNHCRGCFTPISCTNSCKGPSKNPKCNILTCCAEVRALAIFETLGGFDRQFMTERAESASRALAMSKNKSTSKSVGPGGTGYGTGQTQYNSRASASKLKFSEQTPVKKRSPWDNAVLRTFDLLAQLLPSPYADDPQVYDMLPHASIGHLVSLSQLPTLLATLLRNDSVTDWIARKETYNAMLSLLRRMADCELTIQCLIGQRWDTATTCGIEDWMWCDGEITWTTNSSGEPEILPPLYTYFKKLTKQSEAFLVGATQMLGEGGNDDEIDETMMQGTSLCGDIIAARDDLERVIAVLGRPSSSADRDNRVNNPDSTTHTRRTSRGKGRDLSIHVDKRYEEACEKLCFKHVSLAENATTTTGGLHYGNYNYATQLAQTQTSTRNPKNRLHLLKELAVTATSLPPGIWVRVDEVRNDAIKVMIAGPEGTPYAGGLFEFDCFIPLEYPHTPPSMHLRTTGGGKVRFNPNLYDSGKVCLSLLGTWPGSPEEQWSPKSTLLQVLVSIQSMILIDAPYFNEPGHGQANVKSPVSIEYNRNISQQTTKWAIVDWLQDKHGKGIWRDVIASHFTIKGEKIREQIIAWNKENSSIRSYQAPQLQYGNYYPVTTNNVAQCEDLLANFDKGMRTIESWKIDGDEE